MNLQDIRNAIFSQADWAPTQSPDAITRVDLFINRALFQMAQEAPFLFFEETLKIATLPDKTPDTAAILAANPVGLPDNLSVVTTDPWVLERNRASGTAGLINWDETGRWNSRMIEITDTQGQIHRHRIRDIWTSVVGIGPGAVENQRLSLYRPWHNVTATALTYRIYNEAYYLPDDVIEVNSLRLFRAGQNWPLEIVGQFEAEEMSLADVPARVASGVPRVAYRRGHFQIETPTKAPRLGLNDAAGGWTGPDHAGQFDYVFTYTWGYRDGELQDFGPEQSMLVQPNDARFEPRFESAPSPSTQVTLANNVNGVEIFTPSVDYMQGFGKSGAPTDPRYLHGGWRKRIYRRRNTVLAAAPAQAGMTTGEEERESINEYLLLFDIPGHQTSVVDQGLVLADYHRRLRDVHGYEALMLYPRPDRRYEIDVRCTRRPKRLADNSDVPPLHVDAVECLVHRALVFLYEAQGNPPLADRALQQYQTDLFTLTKRYGDLRYPAEVLRKRPARAQRVIDSRRPYRRWYNLP